MAVEIVLPASTAAIISYYSLKTITPFAQHWQLVDKPSDRKIHTGNIPLVGGIAIFLGIALSLFVWQQPLYRLESYILSSAIIVMIGVLDDKYDLSVGMKFGGQFLAASVMIFGADLYIEDLGNLLGTGDIHLGIWGIPLTYFAILGAINAFNMIDGIDGLAGTLAITTLLGLATMFAISQQQANLMLPIVVSAAIIPFLASNLASSDRYSGKVFLGDSGSMYIGLTVVWLLALGSQGDKAAFTPVVALWLVAIPLMDMTVVMYRRVRKGQSPFKPDRDHLHHILIRFGLSDRHALMVICCLSYIIVSSGIALALSNFPDWYLFIGFLALFSGYSYSTTHIGKLIQLYMRQPRPPGVRPERGSITS